MSEIFDLLTQFFQDKRQNEIEMQLEEMKNTNPVEYLNQCAQISQNEENEEIIRKEALILIQKFYKYNKEAPPEYISHIDEAKNGEIIEICLHLISNSEVEISKFAGCALGRICAQNDIDILIVQLIDMLLSAENPSQQKGCIMALSEVVPTITYDRYEPFHNIKNFLFEMLSGEPNVEVFCPIFKFFVNLMYTIPYALNPKELQMMTEMMHMRAQDERFTYCAVDFFVYLSEEKSYFAMKHFPFFIDIFNFLIGNQAYTIKMLNMVKAVLEESYDNNDDMEKLEGLDENYHGMLNMAITFTNDEIFPITIDFIKEFIYILEPQQIAEEVEFYKAQLVKIDDPFSVAAIFYIFARALRTIELFPFLEIVENKELLSNMMKEPTICRYIYVFLNEIAKNMLIEEEKERFYTTLLQYLDIETSDENELLEAKIKLVVNIIIVDFENENVGGLIEMAFDLCKCIIDDETINSFNYISKLIRCSPEPIADTLFSQVMQIYCEGESYIHQKQMIHPIMQYIDRFPQKCVGLIGEIVPKFIEVSLSDSPYASESIMVLCLIIKVSDGAYEIFYEETLNIIRASLERISEPQQCMAAFCLIDEVIKAKKEILDISITEVLKSTAINSELPLYLRGEAILCLYHFYLMAESEEEIDEEVVKLVITLFEERDIFLSVNNFDSSSDYICGVMGLLRKFIELGHEEFMDNIIELLSIISDFSDLLLSVVESFLESCIILLEIGGERGREVICEFGQIMTIIRNAATLQKSDARKCKELAQTVISYFHDLCEEEE